MAMGIQEVRIALDSAVDDQVDISVRVTLNIRGNLSTMTLNTSEVGLPDPAMAQLKGLMTRIRAAVIATVKQEAGAMAQS